MMLCQTNILRGPTYKQTSGSRRCPTSAATATPRIVRNQHGRKVGKCVLRTSSAAVATVPETNTFNIEAEVNFLREDLTHLFDDRGITASKYDDTVEFRDPISKYSNIQGYLFNISFLKNIFDPCFELHDIRATGPDEVTTRWTMTMKFTPAANTPLGKFWSPQLTFTGTSIYGYNPQNGKINRHIDTWDSIYNQNYFSLEAFSDFLKQMSEFSATPKLETPDYTILRRQKSGSLIYEVRRYEPFAVAEAPMDEAASGVTGVSTNEYNPAGPGTRAFNALAGYIFGKNKEGLRMKMTTPVFSTNQGTMSFVIGRSELQANKQLPTPLTETVKVTEEPGGLYAVLTFNGRATPEEVSKQEWLLREAVVKDGMVAGLSWKLARYNDPSTPDFLRRNEILIPVDGFDLWQLPMISDTPDSLSYGE